MPLEMSTQQNKGHKTEWLLSCCYR